ncbi:MAG: FAD-dependent oxidoreductase [Pseudomonadota bacterium]
MSKHVVVIGAVALGPKAACRFKRLDPTAKVTMIDQAPRISYGGCGIPYYISGEVNNIKELQATPYNTVRDPEFFRINKDVDAMVNTRATAINRAEHTVDIEDVVTGERKTLSYDKLVFALGSKANRPPIEGIDLEGITPVTNLEEAEAVRTALESRKVKNAVIIGGGFIGLEMAVALADMWGTETSLIELADQVMPGFVSKGMNMMIQNDLAKNGVTVYTGEKAVRFEGENGHVCRVVTDNRTLDAELVIMAAGIAPNTAIAREAGIEVDGRGTIIVDEYMRTSDPDIYAGGDCVTIPHLVADKPWFFPLGSMANRQGRIIGTNLAGGSETFKGGVGSWCVKLFSTAAAGVGLTIEGAKRLGLDAISVQMAQLDRAHFYPEKSMINLHLVVEKPTRRILGLQGFSADGAALLARINTVAAMLQIGKPTVADICTAEVAYSPPFASAMDVLNNAGNVADNMLSGQARLIGADEFAELWANRENSNDYFADSRLLAGAVALMEKYPGEWHSIPEEDVEKLLADIPKDRRLVLMCNTGLRSYDTQLILEKFGITNTLSVGGGMTAVRAMGKEF